jgi:hypothetical protein
MIIVGIEVVIISTDQILRIITFEEIPLILMKLENDRVQRDGTYRVWENEINC